MCSFALYVYARTQLCTTVDSAVVCVRSLYALCDCWLNCGYNLTKCGIHRRCRRRSSFNLAFYIYSWLSEWKKCATIHFINISYANWNPKKINSVARFQLINAKRHKWQTDDRSERAEEKKYSVVTLGMIYEFASRNEIHYAYFLPWYRDGVTPGTG